RIRRVSPNALPNTRNVAARCINDHAPLFFQHLAGTDFRAESGNNDDIVRAQAADFFVGRLWGYGSDAHVADLVVHLWVVNDFAEQIDRFGQGKTLRAA